MRLAEIDRNALTLMLRRYDHGRIEQHDECRYNQNGGYVIFSAMGSFFIPMAVMVYVYVRISCVVASRHDHMKEIEVHKVIAIVTDERCSFE